VSVAFSYEEFTQRNIGFINTAEQDALRNARVFVCGVGGMGGACLQALARAGIEQFVIADFDVFEVSNLNRQVFANLDTVGVGKVEATVQQLRRINPQIQIQALGREWPDHLDTILATHKLIINGMDDLAAGIELYRKARQHGATVIDAYTSPLPSVVVVQPHDPRPEERLRYPSQGIDWKTLTQTQIQACFACEVEYVMVNSSSARHIDLQVAKELIAGQRKRMSFAPMVIATGNLMAFEAVKIILSKPPFAGAKGYFFNPWTLRTETPRHAVSAWLMRKLVRRFMSRLLRD
jgi:molybdopterin-synthase adenylyltransferase